MAKGPAFQAAKRRRASHPKVAEPPQNGTDPYPNAQPPPPHHRLPLLTTNAPKQLHQQTKRRTRTTHILTNPESRLRHITPPYTDHNEQSPASPRHLDPVTLQDTNRPKKDIPATRTNDRHLEEATHTSGLDLERATAVRRSWAEQKTRPTLRQGPHKPAMTSGSDSQPNHWIYDFTPAAHPVDLPARMLVSMLGPGGPHASNDSHRRSTWATTVDAPSGIWV